MIAFDESEAHNYAIKMTEVLSHCHIWGFCSKQREGKRKNGAFVSRQTAISQTASTVICTPHCSIHRGRESRYVAQTRRFRQTFIYNPKPWFYLKELYNLQRKTPFKSMNGDKGRRLCGFSERAGQDSVCQKKTPKKTPEQHEIKM